MSKTYYIKQLDWKPHLNGSVAMGDRCYYKIRPEKDGRYVILTYHPNYSKHGIPLETQDNRYDGFQRSLYEVAQEHHNNLISVYLIESCEGE